MKKKVKKPTNGGPEPVPDEKQNGNRKQNNLTQTENLEEMVVPADQPAGLVKIDVSDYEPLGGTDDTSVSKITSIYYKDEEKDPTSETVEVWIKNVSRSDVQASAELKGGIELARLVSDEYNEFYHVSQMTLTARAILIGKILLALKDLAKKAGFIWTTWANNNVAFIKERNRERFMTLALRKDCYRYMALGVERLEMLVSATRGIKDDPDPIGTFLKRYHIEYAEDSEEGLSTFKSLIDAALANERLRRNEITKVDFKVIQQLTQFKVEFNQTLITNLKEVEASGGSQQRYLENLAVSAGKRSKKSDKEKKLEDFNSLSARMEETLDAMVDDESQLDKVDIKGLLRLFEKLQALKANLVPNEEVQTA